MLQVQDQFIFEIAKPLKNQGTIKYCSTETNIQILYCTPYKETNLQNCGYRSLEFTVIAAKKVKDCLFRKCNTLTVNLQKFVQLYQAVCTHMKQRNVVVDRVRIEHRIFRSSRNRQSQETGSYIVIATCLCLSYNYC